MQEKDLPDGLASYPGDYYTPNSLLATISFPEVAILSAQRIGTLGESEGISLCMFRKHN